MKMRIIDIIEFVDMRNKNLLSDKPMGINIDKYFMPSVANTIGVDLKTYKLVPHNCFACNLMHVGRDERVPMAINKKEDPVLVSPAYLVFRVKESVDVLPDFLMLWFRRPTFDRNAWFFTAGDVRGGLDKKDFFNMEVHVPDIATQRRIVAEYQAVEKRIATNEQLIAKLEDTAQTIYKKTFVDNVDLRHLPDGWRMGTLTDVADFKYGKLPDKHERSTQYAIPVYSGYSITGYTDIPMFDKKIVVIIARGDSGTGRICLSPSRCFLSNLAIGIIPKRDNFLYFLYYYLTKCDTYSLRSGSAQAQITINNLEPFPVLIPSSKETDKFQQRTAIIDSHIDSIISENAKLLELKDLLLTKLTTND